MRGEWQERFGSLLPLGYRLRVEFPERWIRIYSLPEGKRYPECESERETLLERQYAVANHVLGSSPSCSFFSCRYHLSPGEREPANVGSIESIHFSELWRTTERLDPSDPDEEPTEIAVFGAKATWSNGTLRGALLAVANDEENLVALSHDTGNVFAPYDGGVDVILTGSEEVRHFRAQFEQWLSPLESGL